MIKFYDPSGASHFGQATITRTTSVNGGLSLTGEVFDGDDVLNGLDYGWWLNFDNEKYVITYKKLSDDTNTIVFDAVQQFFWDFAKVALHSQYTGSHEYAFYLNQLFNGSGYTYQNDVTVPAFEKENWGYKNKLSLFNDIMDQADVEFEVHNETVHIAKQIGSDLTSFVRKGINLSDLTEEIKISDFATYAKGYGAFEDPQDPSKGRLEVEYRSELADKFGVLEMDPIVDERYTIANNLIAELKKKIDATYTVSMTMNIYDLESAGYPNYESPKVGDWILAIDEALNFKRKIRIIKLEEKFDVTGKRIGYIATCGDLSIVDQYTNLQGSLDSKVQRIQESIDSVAASANGKNSNYYGAKEPVNANEGDLWFDQSNSDPDKWTIKQWLNGRWEQITLNPGEISDKVNAVKVEAKSASEKADQLAAKYDDTNLLASQAFDRATSAQSEAGSAIAKAESTASEFGKVSQKADSAFDNAMSAQSAASSAVATAHSTASEFSNVSQKADSAVASALNAQSSASDAVKQASSAAADSKDAKQIAGAVSQSYKTLTDGSTMTIAELESGLAVKLTKDDLDGYATETWTQNKIKATADGISGTLSSVKSTVDSQTTSINDLKADSSSFKSQFTTVNDTLGKQTTDIGTLQASSKELTSGFNTLTTDNKTNKNDISQLKQTATEVSSTLETVKTQVQNSAVGTNLLTGTSSDWVSRTSGGHVLRRFYYTVTSDMVGNNYTFSAEHQDSSNGGVRVETWYKDSSGKRNGIKFGDNSSTAGTAYETFTVTSSMVQLELIIGAYNVSNQVENIRHEKLEKGSLATDWSPAPEDMATVTAFSELSQTVDGMRADISKKIEKKDLNGYATQTWAQNQINTTADGINGTISSVKSTVDSHTTSINDLQADSRGFKAQFQTVNDTIGKHTTDIGSLQASSKELTSGFNTLTSDNTTNKNDISQLKQTATEVSSTLETVQTQVQNSAVGTNLLTNSDFSSGLNKWRVNSGTNADCKAVVTTDSDGDTCVHITGTGNSCGLYCWPVSFNQNKVTTGSVLVKGTGTLNAVGLERRPFSNFGTISTESYSKVGSTMQAASGTNSFCIYFDAVNGVVDIYIKFVKLELGSHATDYSTSPLDTATVTAFSKLSQTVDGMKADISKKIEQKDLNGYATQTWAQNQIKTTADGINGTISSVKSTVNGHTTSINDLQADSRGFKAQFDTVTGTLDKQSTDIGTLQASSKSLSASFDSLSYDNQTNQHNISQLQASAETFNSTLMTVQTQVQNSAVGTNLLIGTSSSEQSYTGDFSTVPGWNIPVPASQIAVNAGSTYTYSIYLTKLTGSFVLGYWGYDSNKKLPTWFPNYTYSSSGKVSWTFTIPSGISYITPHVVHRSNDFACTAKEEKLELGSRATDWCSNPADNASVTAVSSISQTIDSIQTTVRGKVDNETYQSKIDQLSDQINLRVESKGVINAVNVSKEGIQIYGDKLHITATTYIDDAIIKNAMIESINAEKITAGTIDASKIQVIHLNANNITTGAIHGSNLDINLNTGNVEFQKGRIHSYDNGIDINIDNKYISVANSSNRVMLKDGEMQFVQPGVLDLQTSPYFRIHNRGGLAFGGAEMVGRDYVAVSNAANSDDFFMHTLGVEKFSGLFTGYNRASHEWRPTKIAGAERGVIISGGSVTSGQTLASSPSIIVGYSNTNSNLVGGNRILLDAAFVHSFSTYTKTSSKSSNVYVSDDGALLRSTSAAKYKTNIERSFETKMGERILEVPTAHWFDKEEVRKKTLDPQSPDPRRYFGMIADDLDEAGLTELVEYNKKGEVEGLMYDRIALTLIPLIRDYRNRIIELETEVKKMKEV